MMPPSDRDLDRALADLAAQLAYPPTPDIASGVARRLANRPARTRPLSGRAWRLAFALVVLVAVAGAILTASPEVRTAIADRLGLRGVTIRQVPMLPTPAATPAIPMPASVASPPAPASPALSSAATRLNLGQPMTLEQARTRVAYAVLVPGALGDPDEVYVLDSPVGGQVALVYHPRPDLPQAKATGIGLLLTEFRGSPANGVVGKGLPPGTRIEEIQVNGGRGYWIDGDLHTFVFLDSRGQLQTESTRLAGSVLLWEQGDLTLRLESALVKDLALQIAVSAR